MSMPAIATGFARSLVLILVTLFAFAASVLCDTHPSQDCQSSVADFSKLNVTGPAVRGLPIQADEAHLPHIEKQRDLGVFAVCNSHEIWIVLLAKICLTMQMLASLLDSSILLPLASKYHDAVDAPPNQYSHSKTFDREVRGDPTLLSRWQTSKQQIVTPTWDFAGLQLCSNHSHCVSETGFS